MNISQKSLIATLAALLLGGCSFNTDNLLPDKQVDYKREKQAGSTLEIPPDLTANTIDDQAGLATPGKSSTTYSEYSQHEHGSDGLRRESRVLPQIEGVTLEREGDNRWLLINAPAESVWPKAIEFWQTNGILLIEQDPSAGVMRTGWIENRADVKTGKITNFMRGIFSGMYDAGTRDQFRVRLERTAENRTELYLTHFGMEEVMVTNSSGEEENSVFQHRPRDPQLEAIMLQGMMNFLGRASAQEKIAGEQAAESDVVASQLSSNATEVLLMVNEPFSQAWRYVGLALDRVGFVVEDRDRSNGVYYVRYRDPDADKVENDSWLGKLAFWEGDEKPDKAAQYQISIEDAGQASVVTVKNEQGVRDNSSTAKRILVLIQEQLK